MAFSLTALAVAMVALIRFDLISTWEKQVPNDAPNTFALNITDQDQSDFIQAVTSKVVIWHPYIRLSEAVWRQ